MALIHDENAFTRKAVLTNASKFGFANPLTIELFLWDLELASQLQKSSNEIVLKGGAAAQLFVSVKKQRGSVDIDMTANLDADSLDSLIEEVGSKIGRVKFELYKPKRPKAGLNARTYYAYTDSVTQPERLRVKLDFMLEDLGLPFEEMNGVETFAVKTSKLRCYTPEVLVGDKLLTLARGSIGLKDLADYPKQVYDLSMLIDCPEFVNFEDVIQAVRRIAPIEAKIAGVKIDDVSALGDVIEFIDKELAPIDTSRPNRELKSKLEAFEQFFIPSSQKVSLQEWSSRSLRIRFLASLAQSRLRGTLKTKQCESLLRKAKDFVLKLGDARRDEAERLRDELLAFQKARLPYFKELRGKPLHRVFWQVVTLDKLDRIIDLI